MLFGMLEALEGGRAGRPGGDIFFAARYATGSGGELRVLDVSEVPEATCLLPLDVLDARGG